MAAKTQKQWANLLKKYCQAVGTYRQEFDLKIDLAAQLLVDYEQAKEAFEATGRSRTVMQTNKNGSTNEVKSPVYAVWKESCRDVSSILGDLGLDPKSLKKIDENSLRPEKPNALAAVLSQLA